jgi:hypothetical protein
MNTIKTGTRGAARLTCVHHFRRNMLSYMGTYALLGGLKEILHRWLHISGCGVRGLADAGDQVALHGGCRELVHHLTEATQHPWTEPPTPSSIELAYCHLTICQNIQSQ